MSKKTVPVSLVKADLRGAQSLVEAQMHAGIKRDWSVDMLCKSIMAKVQKMGALHQSDVTELITLSNAGPWANEQKQQFAEHLSGNTSSDNVATATHIKKTEMFVLREHVVRKGLGCCAKQA